MLADVSHGSIASILPRPLSRPLSTTPDITTSDRDLCARRLPTLDLQTTVHGRRSSCVLASFDLVNMKRVKIDPGPFVLPTAVWIHIARHMISRRGPISEGGGHAI